MGDAAVLDALADAFVRSAETPCGSMAGFKLKLKVLKSLTQSGGAPFSLTELDEYLQSYEKLGCPAVHHSESFRIKHRPAYRVISSELAAELLKRRGQD